MDSNHNSQYEAVVSMNICERGPNIWLFLLKHIHLFWRVQTARLNSIQDATKHLR